MMEAYAVCSSHIVDYKESQQVAILTKTNNHSKSKLMSLFKEIDIGKLIYDKVSEENLEMSRICSFLHCTSLEVEKMFHTKSMDSELLLRWSKLLEYDFFRIYSHHLILYSPQRGISYQKRSRVKNSHLPQFRKNIYTKELIDFILDQITSGEKTSLEIIRDYGIPKSTLVKWISKYKK